MNKEKIQKIDDKQRKKHENTRLVRTTVAGYNHVLSCT